MEMNTKKCLQDITEPLYCTAEIGTTLSINYVSINQAYEIHAQQIPEIRELVLWSGRSLGKGSGNPLQYSCLRNPMTEEPGGATVHGVTKNQTKLRN